MNENNKEEAPVSVPDFSKPIEPAVPDPKPQEVFNEPPKKNNEAVFKIIFYTLLTVLILTASYLVFAYSQKFLYQDVPAEEQKLVFENQLVRANKSRVISLEEGASKEAVRNIIIQALQFERVSPGEISLIMPSYLRDTVVNGERKLVSELQRGDDFFFTFAVRAPLNLRTISAERYAIGVVGGNSSQKNFLAFSVSSAPDATREMQRFEAQMYNDLRGLLSLKEISGDIYFQDLSQNNHLLRVAYDNDGIVMVYGFGAPKTIIIAPDTETFEAVYTNLK